MADNSNDGGGGSRVEISSLVVAAVALVVSLVAITISSAQVLQQYLSTAVGYANCGRRVMGPWARFTKLVFHPWELRFEVTYRVPVIFITDPDSGALDFGRDAYVLNGDKKNSIDEAFAAESNTTARPRFSHDPLVSYTATWLRLLYAVQDMEEDNRSLVSFSSAPTMVVSTQQQPGGQLAMTALSERPVRTYVAFRNALQTLDMMPEGVKKPLAVSTISDVVVIVAMLGANWKQFDRNSDRYLAEGYGWTISGFHVPYLGIAFTFIRHHTRVAQYTLVTGSYVELLCYGSVRLWGHRFQGFPSYLLKISSSTDTAESLAVLGWDHTAVACLTTKDHSVRTEHVFPVMFEIIGMMAVQYTQEGDPFSRVPNPAPIQWRSTYSGSVARMLRAFVRILQSERKELLLCGSLYADLKDLDLLFRSPMFVRDEVYDLHSRVHWSSIKRKLLKMLLAIHDTFGVKEHHLGLIVRLHFKTVLSLMNDAAFPDLSDAHRTSPEARLVGFYYHTVRPQVWTQVAKLMSIQETRDDVRAVWDDDDGDSSDRVDLDEATTYSIWARLVLRMLLWLLLHRFSDQDIQIPKGDIVGSKLTVYIT